MAVPKRRRMRRPARRMGERVSGPKDLRRPASGEIERDRDASGRRGRFAKLDGMRPIPGKFGFLGDQHRQRCATCHAMGDTVELVMMSLRPFGRTRVVHDSGTKDPGFANNGVPRIRQDEKTLQNERTNSEHAERAPPLHRSCVSSRHRGTIAKPASRSRLHGTKMSLWHRVCRALCLGSNKPQGRFGRDPSGGPPKPCNAEGNTALGNRAKWSE